MNNNYAAQHALPPDAAPLRFAAQVKRRPLERHKPSALQFAKGEYLMTEHIADIHPDYQCEKLTLREQDILALLSKGMSNKAIAKALGICEKTVKNRVTCILAKLGVSNRVQAALYAERRGLSMNTPTQPVEGLDSNRDF